MRKTYQVPAFLLVEADSALDADMIATDIAINVNNRHGADTVHKLLLDEVLKTKEFDFAGPYTTAPK